ncbi:MAG: T9SS type A sorting domain-containing protein, partial [Ignavibacteriales bacterium]|nr:T9SS type A sorting domain-containing protein [Ignavibacteriales bacterium]
LPVELLSFSVSLFEGTKTRLKWQTATEVNNYGFEIEKQFLDAKASFSVIDIPSEDGEWKKIGFVQGHGNSNSPKYYSFTDHKINSGKYAYRLKQIDIDGKFEYSDIVEIDLGLPTEFSLSQNYPNPFNPTTSIKFNLPTDSNVKLSVFNVLGEEVAELINNNLQTGYHSVEFNASELNSGVYFYKIEAGDPSAGSGHGFVQIRKMMLLK